MPEHLARPSLPQHIAHQEPMDTTATWSGHDSETLGALAGASKARQHWREPRPVQLSAASDSDSCAAAPASMVDTSSTGSAGTGLYTDETKSPEAMTREANVKDTLVASRAESASDSTPEGASMPVSVVAAHSSAAPSTALIVRRLVVAACRLLKSFNVKRGTVAPAPCPAQAGLGTAPVVAVQVHPAGIDSAPRPWRDCNSLSEKASDLNWNSAVDAALTVPAEERGSPLLSMSTALSPGGRSWCSGSGPGA